MVIKKKQSVLMRSAKERVKWPSGQSIYYKPHDASYDTDTNCFLGAAKGRFTTNSKRSAVVSAPTFAIDYDSFHMTLDSTPRLFLQYAMALIAWLNWALGVPTFEDVKKGLKQVAWQVEKDKRISWCKEVIYLTSGSPLLIDTF